jgi:putative SOS response-associated peptidase YedK
MCATSFRRIGGLKPEQRCLAPATSFCEYADSLPKVPHWFALGAEQLLFAFAGTWRTWTGERKREAGEHVLFSILTCAPNDVVRPVHAQAMPVILTTLEECNTWLSAPIDEALALQRPLPSDALEVIATGAKADGESRGLRRGRISPRSAAFPTLFGPGPPQ